MKILAFTDAHGNLSQINRLEKKSRLCDLTLCAGDYSFFSKDINNLLKRLNRFKNLYFINGNHEATVNTPEIIKKNKLKSLNFIDSEYAFFKDIFLIGFGGGGFSTKDSDYHKFLMSIDLEKIFAEHAKKNSLKKYVPKYKIFLSHTPPYGIRSDLVVDEHSGDINLKNFLKNNAFDYCFCGHFHEQFNTIDEIGKTIVINPGPKGLILNI